jgi:hypothetical protein
MARRPITLDHIPPEHHQGIGLVANAWMYLEGAVERIIWRLARLSDKRGMAITTHMGIKGRLDAACALANLEFPDAAETKALTKLKGRVTDADHYGKRNELVHSRTLHIPSGGLGLAPGDTLRSVQKARGTLKSGFHLVDPDEYQTAARTILRTTTDLMEILAGFNTLIKAKAGAPPP